MAKVSDLAKEIAKAVSQYTDDLKKEMHKAQDELTKEGVTLLQSNSPKDTGDYAKGWKRKKTKQGYVLYNEDHFRLTHLLEYGHVKRGGGRVAGKVHIKPIEQQLIDKFEARVEKAIHT